MTGGIYCEVTLGTIYEERLLGRVNDRMRSLFGASLPGVLAKSGSLTQAIIDHWYTDVSRKMGRILSSWTVPGNRGYYNRTVDLTRSICLGVYYRGKLRKMYRFTGGHRELSAFSSSDNGTGTSEKSSFRLWALSRNHPDPAARAASFLQSFKLTYKTGYTLVIAATMPYAVRLEYKGMNRGSKTMFGGYGLNVLSDVVVRMLRSVFDFKQGASDSSLVEKGAPIYGYIFETTGQYEEVEEL